ncbi:hypothetical protein BU24DRAFT_421623 [Aaosphaeria arxii CBS 175.79]|uniref:U4/U6.U5 small nuclear ribonucleoprotein 27kDa protein domain-containing protein n=1 Tax=Aaosphaeria arxii CBS 175.79 TaxID=1450172 RepID=A0A6A5XQZ3_9PLEO|nr:uncharacterized protein BU24DRAFT_421623 [Aaosphaeria arxii CBS 175.79]KAF2015319.1 hypothetical protein BU24DRAFT_421623 [Aaosphaeria arxii CBS 175.79]
MASRDGSARLRDRERDYDRAPTRDRDVRERRDDRGGEPHDRRNRSRSPRHERGGRRSDKNRFRSRSPARGDERDEKPSRDGRGAREPPKGPRGPGGNYRGRDNRSGGPVKAEVKSEEPEDVKMTDAAARPDDMDEDTWEMMKVMGFKGFKTTKNTKVPGNDRNYGVRKDKKMEARQYMNRQGGFNRPLSPGRG